MNIKSKDLAILKIALLPALILATMAALISTMAISIDSAVSKKIDDRAISSTTLGTDSSTKFAGRDPVNSSL